MSDALLMFEDIPVLRFNISEGKYDILSEKHLPWGLRGRIQHYQEKASYSQYDLTQIRIIDGKNSTAVLNWFAGRVLLLSRANAKWIYNMFNFEQSESVENRARIAITCKAVSVLDKYWLKAEKDKVKWENVNLRVNSLNEVVAQVALHGKSLTLEGSLTTPELTTNGAYAKAWRRHNDGQLWLYKLGDKGSFESKVEVMCSNLLDKTNVRHVHYEAGEDEGKYVCMCPCMADDSVSVLPAMEFSTYCTANGLKLEDEVLKLDKDGYYKMFIVDYLLSNRDRHLQNWGLYFSNTLMELLSTHPLFDHNNAFDLEYMRDPNATYLVTGKSIRESAKYALRNCDFKFNEKIKREDFLTQRQYEAFTWRAKDLGITCE